MPYTYEKDKSGRWRTRGQAAGGELMPTTSGGFGPSKPTPKRKDKPAEKPWWYHVTPAGMANDIRYEAGRARRFNAQPRTRPPGPLDLGGSAVKRQMVIGATVRAGSDAALALVNLNQRTWGNYNRIRNPLLRTAVGVIPGALPILGLFGPARDPESTAVGKKIVAFRRAATAALGGRLPEEMNPADNLYEETPAGFAANVALAYVPWLQVGRTTLGTGIAAKSARWGLNTAANEAAANLVTDNTMGGASSLLKAVGVPVPDALSADPTRDDRTSAAVRETLPSILFAAGLGGAAALFQQSPNVARAIRDNRTKQDLVRARQRTVANGLQEEDPATGQHSFTQTAQAAPPPPPAPAPAPAKPPGSPLEQSAAVLGITPEELAARRGMPAPAAPAPEPPKPIPSVEGDFTTFGKVEPGELPQVDPAQDPWAVAPAAEAPAPVAAPEPAAPKAADDVEPVYDPELPEIDHVALALERLDPEVVEQIIQAPGPVLPRIEEALASQQPVAPRPELTSTDVAAPTERLAESQFLSRRDEWANLRGDELLGVFHPEVNPELFDAIHARTGRSYEELTREDALETLSAMADAGQTVIPSRLAKGIDLMRTGDIGVDANTFQFKLGTDSQGRQRGNSLEGVDRWNTAMEGAILVWEDPKTGKTWVVNGHNRLAKAKELGIPTVPVKRLLAETAEQARALGALDNIASGGGTAWDAAKFFKTAGVTTPEQVQKAGVPLSADSGNGLKGLQLAQLPDNILQAGIDGELSVGKAVALGGSGLSPEKMQSVWEISRTDKDFKGEDSFKELIAYTRDAPTTAAQGGRAVQGGIPGLESAAERDLTKAKLKLARKIASNLADDKNALKGASRNAGILEAKGNNKIDANTSMQTGLEAEQLARVFDAMKYTADNEISRLLNEGAAEIAAGAKPDMVARRIQGGLAQAAESVVMPAKAPEVAAPVAPEPPMPKTAQDHEANQMLVLNRAAAQGEVRPSATPIPEPPAPPQIDVAKAARGINAQDVISGDDQLKFAQQQRQGALDAGDTKAVEAWDQEIRKVNQGRLGAAQDAQAASQTGLFGVTEYDTSMPLFNGSQQPSGRLSDRFADLMGRMAKSDADMFRTIGEQNAATRQMLDEGGLGDAAGDVKRLAGEEQRLAAEYLERDTALEQETARAEREAMGYHDMTFEQKKAEAGVAEGWGPAEPAPVPPPPPRFFHGSAGEFALDRGGEFGGDGMNIYGDGLYTTDSLGLAGKYQKKNKSRGAEINGVTYEVVEKRPTKFFDLDKPASSKILDKLREQVRPYSAMDDFVNDAIDQFAGDASLGKVFDEMRAASRSANIPAHEVQEFWYEFTEELKKDGYGGFTHEGGRLAGGGKQLHQVRIYWDPAESVEIHKLDAEGNRIAAAAAGVEVKPLPPPTSKAGKDLAKEFKRLEDLLSNARDVRLPAAIDRRDKLATQGVPTQQADDLVDQLTMQVTKTQEQLDKLRAEYGIEAVEAAAAPARAIEIPAAADKKLNPNRVQGTAEILAKWANAGFITADTLPIKSMDQAMELVRAKNRQLWSENIPGIDLDKANNDLAMGRYSQAVQDVSNAYRQFYGVEMPGGEGQARNSIVRASQGDNMFTLPPDKPRSKKEQQKIQRFLEDIIEKVAGDDVVIRYKEKYEMVPVGKEWGGKPGEYAPRLGFYLPSDEFLSDVIQVNGIGHGDLLSLTETAYHEAFHRIQFVALGEAEAKVLDTRWARFKIAVGSGHIFSDELIAYGESQPSAFQRYAAAKRAGKDPVANLLRSLQEVSDAADSPVWKAFYQVASGFDRIFDFAEKVYNLLAGNGFLSTKSVFKKAYKGDLINTYDYSAAPVATKGETGWFGETWNFIPIPKEEEFNSLASVLRQVDDGKLKGVSKRALDAAEKGDHALALAEARDYASRRMAEIDNRIEGIKQRAIEEGC